MAQHLRGYDKQEFQICFLSAKEESQILFEILLNFFRFIYQ